MHRGYIKLWRCIEDNELWQEKPFDRARAWIDLIRKARHEDGSVWIRGIEIKLKKGQLSWSEVSLAENWGWSRGKVRRFLKMLKTKQQIEQENTNVTSLITIKNYDLYNPKEHEIEQQVEHQVVQQKDSKRYTKKNGNNYKNEKNTLVPSVQPTPNDEEDSLPVESRRELQQHLRPLAMFALWHKRTFRNSGEVSEYIKRFAKISKDISVYPDRVLALAHILAYKHWKENQDYHMTLETVGKFIHDAELPEADKGYDSSIAKFLKHFDDKKNAVLSPTQE